MFSIKSTLDSTIFFHATDPCIRSGATVQGTIGKAIMSRQKRPANTALSDDENSASSSPPQYSSSVPGSDGRKRRRISVGSDTTPEQAPNGTGNGDSNDSSDDSTDEEALEAQATQVLQEKRARNQEARDAGDWKPAKEYGILESITLTDFMCHENFTYDFGPNINFICGRNGSGKSAVLTALILCLGGKASSTNRGKGLKEFIRHGCHKASIIVKLKNEGPSAYQNQEYGDSLIVERHFTATGTSGYKIKTASGRVISEKRGDLDPILDHYDLQVDNPLNVLSQDNARQFIGTSKVSEKYKMFMKGVQLERLDEDYRLLEDRLGGNEQKLARKKEDIKHLREARDEKKRQLELAKKRDNLRQNVRDMRRKVGWCQVRDEERKLAAFDTKFAEADDKIRNCKVDVEEQDKRVEAVTARYEETQAALDQAKAAVDTAEDESRQLNNAYTEARDQTTEKQQEQKNVEGQLKARNREKKTIEKEIAEEEQRLNEANDGGAARRQQERDEAQKAVEKVRAEYNDHHSKKAEVESDHQAKTASMNQKYNAKVAAEKSVDEARERLNQARNIDERMNFDAYRRGTDKLLQLISRETRWQSPPLGPLGRHVKLLKPEWAPIIEAMFGKTLNGFLVTSKHDLNLLSNLKKQARCDCEMYLLNDRRQINLREPDGQFLSVLRALEIDSPEVQKHLVIAHAIEQALLIPDMEEANRTMYSHGRLRNVRGCYAFHGNSRDRGILLRYSAESSGSQDPVKPYGGAARMKGDMRAAIAAAQANLVTAQEIFTAAKDDWLEARKLVERAKFAKESWGKQDTNLRAAMQEVDDRLSDLNDQIAQDSVEGGKLTALRESLTELNEQIQLTGELFKDAYAAYQEKASVMRERNNARAEHDTVLKEVRRQHSAAKESHKESVENKDQAILEKNKLVNWVDDARRTRAGLEEDQVRQAELVQAFTAECIDKLGNRIPVPDDATHESLVKEHDKLRARLDTQQRHNWIPIDDAMKAAAAAQIALNNAELDSKGFLETQELLSASLNERRVRWEMFRQRITARARVNFIHLLSQRSFRGALKIDHRTKGLDVQIEPDITRRNDKGRAAQTLSGGEKSYAQICMLLAVWDAMGSPLRCLDEFDVFMDAVNRSTSIKMIIGAARESSGRQYILISPGAKSDYPIAEDVHVQELHPPAREEGQTDIRQAMRGGVQEVEE